MGTKVLNPSLETDIRPFKHALHVYSKRCSGITDSLINVQRRWIFNEDSQGIKRSKDLFDLWKRWISTGCNPAVIPPLRQRHSLRGKLQDAMRLVLSITDTTDRYLVINLISTALRYHELHGPSKKEVEKKTVELISTITAKPDNKPLGLGYWGNGDMSSLMANSTQLNAYKAMRMLRVFLNNIHKYKGITESGNPRPLNIRRIPLKVEPEHAELLIKKSPHKAVVDGKTIRLRSIAAEPLDVFALESVRLNGRTNYFDANGQIRNGVDDSLRDKTLMDLLQDISSIFTKPEYNSAVVWARRRQTGELAPNFIPEVGEIIPIEDKAGKVRPIATSVYTVNEVLAPLHNWMFALLKQFPGDSTDQSIGLSRAKNFSSHRSLYLKSADLSAATDTLPRLVQRFVLENLLIHFSTLSKNDAKRIAYLWDILMGNLQFQTPLGKVTYGTGQPMGVYTSWPMLALTNHVIAMSAAYHYHDKWHHVFPFIKCGYAVCGDDIFISNKGAAANYTFMMNSFGVQVNDLKSYESLSGNISCVEFCKRLFVDGQLVTGASPKALYRATVDKEATLVPQAIESVLQFTGGNTLTKDTLSRIAGRYPKALLHIPLEYGGLGSVSHVSRTEILSTDGFLILYVYERLKGLKRLFDKSLFDVKPDHELDSLASHIDLMANIPSELPENPHRIRDAKWRHLLNRKQYTGTQEQINLLDYCLYELGRIINDRYVPDNPLYDFYELAQSIAVVFDKVKPNVFKGVGAIHDSHDSYNDMSIKLTKVALKVNKNIQRAKLGKNNLVLVANWDTDKDVFVSLIEYLDALLK